MSEDDGTVFAAMRAGARGYLLKGADQEEIVRADQHRRARRGRLRRRRWPPGSPSFFAAGAAAATAAFPELTERERQVLDLVAAGRSNAQIAQTLFLSPKTVRNVVSNDLRQDPASRTGRRRSSRPAKPASATQHPPPADRQT